MIASGYETDARVAQVLAEFSAFQHWDNRPLSRSLRQMLLEMDEQTLMSLAVHALQRVVAEERETR
jgi:hypothetical protein